MKKLLPYILIFVIVANFFAPYSFSSNTKTIPRIVENRVEADDGGINMTITPSKSSNEIKFKVDITWSTDSGTAEGVRITLKDKVGKVVDQKNVSLSSASGGNNRKTGTVSFSGLAFSSNYTATVEARQVARLQIGLTQGIIWNTNNLWNDGEDYDQGVREKSLWSLTREIPVTTQPLGITTFEEDKATTAFNEESILTPYSCNPLESGSWSGCFARILYSFVFQPTAWVFAWTGKLLDWTFFYSIDSQSYRSAFVTEGWAIVRDLCNMFFIFVLLYIAVRTILQIHDAKTKEMIINVVIIGLFINFSLFVTQVIIDSSNVLARVFYNTNIVSVGDTKDSTGKIINRPGENGEIRMSEAIVNKLNPQKLIIEAKKVSQDGESLSAGTFIIVTLMASIVNIVGLIVFLSVALIFIARVVGLWFAMIVAPLAFFTYTIPALQDTKNIGWAKWWPETIKLAFLAPVFMFFMYIILKFLQTGLGILDADPKKGLGFMVAIMVPFIFIMILLWKAKDFAKDMSGELGQKITGAVAAAGGIALGGAALGAAFLGRNTIGAVSKYVQNDGARKKDVKLGQNVKSAWSGVGMNPFKAIGAVGKTISATGKAATAGLATGIHKIPTNTKDAQGNVVKTTWGKRAQEQDSAFSKKQSAVSSLDSKAGEMGSKFGYEKDVKYGDMKETEQKEVRESVDKDTISKEVYGKKFSELRDVAEVNSVKEAFNHSTTDPNTGKLNFTAQAIQRDPVHPDKFITKTISSKAGGVDGGEALDSYRKTSPVIGEFLQALRKGSMDIRNISQLKAKSGGLAGGTVGLAAIIAGGVRLGLKKGVGVEHGTGQKDLFKDLGNTITEALKSVKVEVPKSSGGGGDSHGAAAHGGGGGHH